MADPRPKIFLSYGRKDARDLAEHLYQDLRTHSYEPWRDERHLVAGATFDDQIQEAIRSSRLLIAILSPHSVRKQAQGTADSLCLDEIHLARFADPPIPIVPVLAVPCDAPPVIQRIHWVDFTGGPAAYDKAFEQLIQDVEAALHGHVRYKSWIDRLQPLDFTATLRVASEGFVGRGWLVDRVRTRLVQSEEACLLLTGDPGIGKTAFVARLVSNPDCGPVVAHHFCRAGVESTVDPGRFVQSVAAMIGSALPGFAGMLEAPTPQRELGRASADPVSAFELGVLTPLAHLAPAENALIVVDALDEALGSGRPSIPDLIAATRAGFPPWLRLLCTARGEDAVKDRLRGLQAETIDANDDQNRDDVASYLNGKVPPELAVKIADAAKGNFLYAKEALREAQAGNLAGTEALPDRVGEWFARHFERRFPSDAAFEDAGKVLEAMVAAEEPLSAQDLETATGLDANRRAKVLAALSAYLPERRGPDGTVRWVPFHKSVVDWLTDEARAHLRFFVARGRGHARLAEAFWALYQSKPGSLTAYALAHLPQHLAAAAGGTKDADALLERLVTFVCDPRVQAKRKNAWVPLERALELALETCAAHTAATAARWTFASALSLDTFRHDNLVPEPVFAEARQGRLDLIEAKVDLFPSPSPVWRELALAAAAWLAHGSNPAAASALRGRVDSSHHALVAGTLQRLDAAWTQTELTFPKKTAPNEADIQDIMREAGKLNAEGFSLGGDEMAHNAAQRHARVLVAFAEFHPDPRLGSQPLRDYVTLQAANSYKMYRGRALEAILEAVLEHKDAEWVRDMLPLVCAPALAGGSPEFEDAVRIALCALRERAGGAAGAFAALGEELVKAAGALEDTRAGGDLWGRHRHALSVYAECAQFVFGDSAAAHKHIEIAHHLPYGYAGFGYAAQLRIAEARMVAAGTASPELGQWLDAARVAANCVVDVAYCATVRGRVDAIAALMRDPAFEAQREFPMSHGLHVVGARYEGRGLPPPFPPDQPQPLSEVARVFGMPVARLARANPSLPAGPPLPAGTELHIPDPGFGPVLAAWLTAVALADPTLFPDERLHRIQTLVPAAVQDHASGDAVLARLLLAMAPDGPILAAIQQEHDEWMLARTKRRTKQAGS